jgi:hypothetical protein
LFLLTGLSLKKIVQSLQINIDSNNLKSIGAVIGCSADALGVDV